MDMLNLPAKPVGAMLVSDLALPLIAWVLQGAPPIKSADQTPVIIKPVPYRVRRRTTA
jgi:hypothetical protein